MDGSSKQVTIRRNSSSTVSTAYLVKLSPEVVEWLKENARSITEVQKESGTEKTLKRPKLLFVQGGKTCQIKVGEQQAVKLKHVAEAASEVEFYESRPGTDRTANGLVSLSLNSKVVGKLFQEKQLSEKVSEQVKKRVLQADKEAHAHDIKVIQPLENKRRGVLLNDVRNVTKRHSSLPPVLKRTPTGVVNRNASFARKPAVSSKLTSGNSLEPVKRIVAQPQVLADKQTSQPVTNGWKREPQSYRQFITNKEQLSSHKRTSFYRDESSTYPPSKVTRKSLTVMNRVEGIKRDMEEFKKPIDLRSFVIHMLFLSPFLQDELEAKRKERLSNVEDESSLEGLLREVAWQRSSDNKWCLKLEFISSVDWKQFHLYSSDERQEAEKNSRRFQEQRRLCSEEEVSLAMEAFQEGKEPVGHFHVVNEASMEDRDACLNLFIQKYRLYYTLVCRLKELGKSSEDLRKRYLSASSEDERNKFRERIALLEDKHGVKYEVMLSLIHKLEGELSSMKNKLQV